MDSAKANVAERSNTLWEQERQTHCERVDRMFVILMIVQFLTGIAAALFISPTTWIGAASQVHVHVWAAVLLGGTLSGGAIAAAWLWPGTLKSRITIAIAQGLWSALLIHLTGGRLETHFHVFGSLAFIAFYHDSRALIATTIVVAADHALRGIWWPLSVYGIETASPYRWMEHAGWVVFEDIILLSSIVRGRAASRVLCDRQAELELVNNSIEATVTQRTAELDEARKEAERLALVAKYTDNSVLILDRKGRIEWINEGFTRTTGYSLEEAKGYVPIDLLGGPETSDETVRTIRRGLREQSAFDASARKHHKDGQPIDLEIESRPTYDKNGKFAGFFQIEREVTRSLREQAERKRMQRELQSSAQHLSKLALVAQHTSDAVIIADASGRAEWVNDGFTRLTGLSVDRSSGLSLAELVLGADSAHEFRVLLEDSLAKCGPFEGEFQALIQGKLRWLDIEIRPVHSDTGEVNRFIGVISDISQRKQAEEEKSELDRRPRDTARMAGKAEVASEVLHNVGNVLNSLNVATTMLREHLSCSHVSQLTKAAKVIAEQDDLAEFLTCDSQGKHFPQFIQQL
ncbi:MAG: PAS domain-containing protein, partial [Planctomycetaceae bacterium]